MILLRKADTHKTEFSKGQIQNAEISKERKTHFSAILSHFDTNWAICV